MKHSHLLIIRFSAIGDVAMLVPVVWALAQQYPDLRITVLSRPMMRTLFENLAPNVNFMGADVKEEYHGVKGLNALFRRLAAKHPTHIADMHSVLRTEYLRMRFNLGFYRVEHLDKHRQQRRRLVAAQPNKVLEPLPTSFDNYLDVLARLGFPVNIEKHRFHSIFQDKNPKELIGLIPAISPKASAEERWLGIAPFATYKGKIYPLEKMQQVIQLIIDHYPKARIFLFGRGQEEENTFTRWTNQWPQCVYVGQQLENFYQELILMSHLDVMVSMDSANMHLASLTATPVVSIWGATHPFAGFMGWNQHPENAIGLDMPCRPCSIYGKTPCRRGDYACLNNIASETIFEIINRVLTKNQTEQ